MYSDGQAVWELSGLLSYRQTPFLIHFSFPLTKRNCLQTALLTCLLGRQLAFIIYTGYETSFSRNCLQIALKNWILSDNVYLILYLYTNIIFKFQTICSSNICIPQLLKCAAHLNWIHSVLYFLSSTLSLCLAHTPAKRNHVSAFYSSVLQSLPDRVEPLPLFQFSYRFRCRCCYCFSDFDDLTNSINTNAAVSHFYCIFYMILMQSRSQPTERRGQGAEARGQSLGEAFTLLGNPIVIRDSCRSEMAAEHAVCIFI